MRRERTQRQGYSLMEAMVALFVLAVASTGLLLATRAHIDSVGGLEDRVTAQWIAENRLAELNLGDPAAAQAQVEMLGRRWRIDVARRATDDPDLIAVEIAVSREGGGASLARLSGFIDAEASA
ncbi:type II secretion system minor pseudopilin GspI [Brevundimonas sp. PAMC22021]|jgi:general secretion pathway protein I|uniref:type II secretion system minor pseudopilin GspI n=1 Tax=Brevundimonas sp. PAMC22021 TaxID=2861285 RepID=UPI001C635683|nr:type II secretion system minor pseudopilin GspI [Brevundimonas sp. PAMC22021]QYF85948.1 type II secretion system minor pseudopilin GspI [Brevundimonas sp. PAMC22021]